MIDPVSQFYKVDLLKAIFLQFDPTIKILSLYVKDARDHMPEGLLNLSHRHPGRGAILSGSCPWQVSGLINKLPRGAPEIAGEHRYLCLVAGQGPKQGWET